MQKTFCDICGKEIKQVEMKIIHGNFDNYQECVIDLCEECSNKLDQENLVAALQIYINNIITKRKNHYSYSYLTDITMNFIQENSVCGSNLKEVATKIAEEILERIKKGE